VGHISSVGSKEKNVLRRESYLVSKKEVRREDSGGGPPNKKTGTQINKRKALLRAWDFAPVVKKHGGARVKIRRKSAVSIAAPSGIDKAKKRGRPEASDSRSAYLRAKRPG